MDAAENKRIAIEIAKILGNVVLIIVCFTLLILLRGGGFSAFQQRADTDPSVEAIMKELTAPEPCPPTREEWDATQKAVQSIIDRARTAK